MDEPVEPNPPLAEQLRIWASVATRVEVDHRWDGGAQLAQDGDDWVLRVGPAEHAKYLSD